MATSGGTPESSFGHADHPLTALRADKLGLGPYAESLAEFIRRCDTPLTVAIQGDWGTGKTSLMYMVQEVLQHSTGGDRIKPIWFHTWQYSQFTTHASLSVSLLSSLLRQISGPENPVLKASMQVLGRLAKPAINAALRLGNLEWDDFAANAGSFQSDPAADADELKNDIKRLIAEKRSRSVERFVIFIDDLDRILPERAVEILEVIKLFLDWEGCVFVLALDYMVVSRGLSQRFNIAEAELGGRSFFDKIIQLPFTIPTARYDVNAYMKELLGGMNLPLGAEDYVLFGRLVRFSVSVNPRGIKRVLNSLQLLVLVAKAQQLVTGADENSDRLVIRNLFGLLCLQMGYEHVYDQIAEHGRELQETHIFDIVRGEGPRNPGLADALAKLSPQKRQDFQEFSVAFADCIQTPGLNPNEIDVNELRRLRQALTLTRLTAVANAEVPDESSFRWKNRRFMEKVAAEIERRLPTDSKGISNKLSLYQPHSSSAVDIYRIVRHENAVSLQVQHSIDSCWVYLTGAKYAVKSAAERLEGSDLTQLDDFSIGSGEIIFLEQEIDPSISFRDREDILLGRVADIFVKVTRYFNGE